MKILLPLAVYLSQAFLVISKVPTSFPLTKNERVSDKDFTERSLLRLRRQTQSYSLPPELWDGVLRKHVENLSRAFLSQDAKVAIYFDPKLMATSTLPTKNDGTSGNLKYAGRADWLFNFTSDVWAYMTKLYGNFGPDPYLNLIVYHGQNNYSGPLLYYSIDKRHVAGQRNALDIGSTHLNAWLTNSTRAEEMDLITNQLANFVEKSSKNRFPSPLRGVWETGADLNSPWVDIFTYDVYRNLGLTLDAERYKTEKFDRNRNKTQDWFKDWFLPIYKKYGGNQVLNKYYQLLHDYLSNSSDGLYTSILNTGGFIHFWSAAAGADLQELAASTFGCDVDFWKKLVEDAREVFPELKKLYSYDAFGACETNKTETHLPNDSDSTANDQKPNPLIPPKTWRLTFGEGMKEVTRVYLDETDHVTVFFDSDSAPQRNANGLFSFISRVWVYMTKSYGEFGPDQYLNLVVRLLLKNGAEVERSVQQSAFQHRNILKVGSLNLEKWLQTIPEDEEMDKIVVNLASFVEFAYKKRFGSPSFQAWKTSSDAAEGDTAWVDIFTYDVYKSLNMTKAAARYLDATLNKVENFPKENTLWFKNWFMEIYNTFGSTQVLKEYFEIVYANVLHRQGIYVEFLDMGGFVHFWSGAAKTDLVYLAKKAFGQEDWDGKYEEQFLKAREKYSKVAEFYLCDKSQSACDLNKYEEKNIQTSTTSATTSDNTPILIGVSVGVIIVLITVSALICSVLFYKRKIQSLETEIRALTSEEVQEFFDGDPNANLEEAQAMVLSLPFVKDFEIPRDQIILDHSKTLGSGQFGSVIHGLVRLNDSIQYISVAMKIVKKNVEVAYFKAFLSEVKIMAYLGRHENIVGLIGTCTSNIKNREIFIALEFCQLGNLKEYLKKNRDNMYILSRSNASGSSVWEPAPAAVTKKKRITVSWGPKKKSTDIPDTANTRISTLDLFKWSQEISSAMVYLTEKKVIHGDLAARNILLTGDRVAKVSDFGLSHQFLNYANYMKTSKTPVPWRWLAIEAMKEMNFSVASDVWAFGVTLWEIFSLSETPYGAWTYDLFFVDRLIAGDRLSMPTYAHEQLYQLMLDCWRMEASDRPTFQRIYNLLGEMTTKLLRSSTVWDNETPLRSPLLNVDMDYESQF